MIRLTRFFLAALLSSAPLVAVRAADLSAEVPSLAATTPGFLSNVMIRGRLIGVFPDSSAHLSVPGSAHVGKSIVPEVDVSYFFTPNFAVETICCVTHHKVDGRGALAGVKIGDSWVIPWTLMGQYHFTNFGRFKPYVGVGVNYSMFFSDDANGPTIRRFKVRDSVGVAGQIGFDYMIDDHWAINVDLKKIYMRPKVKVTTGDGGTITGRAKIDPWIAGVGVAYRF
jgi:outer membrane protein